MSNRPPDTDPPAAGPAWDPTVLVPGPGREPGGGNALPAGTRLGEFELLRIVGEGGFGIVYLAQDHALQRRVAIKEYLPAALAARAADGSVQVLSPKQRAVFDAGLQSFVNEARLLARFDHPALVKVHRFWQQNGTAYMVMPFYEGTTLQQVLRQLGGPPDERWLMALLAPLTEALAAIHATQWLHRDISPDNILLLAGSGQPLLLDFGAARQVIGDATQALTAILKPGFAPLEQYAESSALRQGPWTDVYALCAVVHTAITGSKPPVSVARSVTDQRVPLVRSAAGRYSRRFLQAIDDGLRVRPDERTASIAQLRQALGMDEAAVGALPDAAAAPAPAPADPAAPGDMLLPAGRARRKPRRPPWRWGLAASLALAAAAASIWNHRTDTPRVRPAEAPAAPTSMQRPLMEATPAPPLTIAQAFDQVLQGRQAGFQVEARPDRPRLRIGVDRLGFEVRSSRGGHVYVLAGGPDGSLLLLFPNSVAQDNRIRAGQTLRLPQPSWPLDTTEPLGTEQLLVIVSAQARDHGHLASGREAWFLRLGAAALAPVPAGQAPLAGRARCDAAGCDAYGAASFSVEILP